MSEKQWEGQEAMGERLAAEALGETPVVAIPLEDKIIVYPVVPDEDRPVDLSIVRLGAQDLPDLGVIVAVSWDVNASIIEEGHRIDEKIAEGILDPSMKEAFLAAKALGVGDIVATNKFSGMDVPGTNCIALSRKDCLTKIFNLPVRLRKAEDVESAVREALSGGRREDEDVVVTPSRKIIGAV